MIISSNTSARYQLKIGNYETFLKNQTTSTQFTIKNTDRNLDVSIGAMSPLTDPFSPPNNKYILKLTKEPNLYLVSVLVVTDALLITAYSLLNGMKHVFMNSTSWLRAHYYERSIRLV